MLSHLDCVQLLPWLVLHLGQPAHESVLMQAGCEKTVQSHWRELGLSCSKQTAALASGGTSESGCVMAFCEGSHFHGYTKARQAGTTNICAAMQGSATAHAALSATQRCNKQSTVSPTRCCAELPPLCCKLPLCLCMVISAAAYFLPARLPFLHLHWKHLYQYCIAKPRQAGRARTRPLKHSKRSCTTPGI